MPMKADCQETSKNKNTIIATRAKNSKSEKLLNNSK